MYNYSNDDMWVEKYRPTSLDTYIGNERLKQQFKDILDNGETNHLLLYGKQGGGKTTLAKIIANSLDASVLYINASDENNIDTVRNKIKGFASTIGFQRWKLIILDESDYLSMGAQPALRNLMETFSKTCRFILTCNYPERLIDPLKSRTQQYEITPPDRETVAAHCSNILDQESIKYDIKDVVTVIKSTYPDIRSTLNTLQQFCIKGKLVLDTQTLIENNYMLKVFEVLTKEKNKEKCLQKVRQIIADSKVKNFQLAIDYIFDNLNDLTNNVGLQATIIVILAEVQYQSSLVVNQEINIMSGFTKIIKELLG